MAAGLKKGSYWEKIATDYVNGPPGQGIIKAIYNLWRSTFFVNLVTEMLQVKVRCENVDKNRNLHELLIMIFKIYTIVISDKKGSRRNFGGVMEK